MAKAPAPKKSIAKKDAYKVEGDKLVRTKPGVFMATHKDRVSCGNCGYTEFKQN